MEWQPASAPRMGWTIALALGCVSAFPATALAQQMIVVERNVNLRADPSTGHPAIRLLLPPEELELQDSTRVNGYLFVVRAESHDTGWVWARNVRFETPGGQPSDTMLPAALTTAVDAVWEKPLPVSGTFTSPVTNMACGPTGDGGDTASNRRKNRTDVPPSYHAVTFQALADLAYPATRARDRGLWPAESLAVVERHEGVAIQVVGYLVALKPQTSGSGESTNCHMKRGAEVDWHLAIVGREGEGEGESVVVETTPRVRSNHPKWTAGRLGPWVDAADPVRISGWLFFDPAHRNHLGRYRATLWEIHPITRIEVWQGGAWVDLDDLP